MSLFVIADLHLSLSLPKPMDIFNGWENYTEKIKDNWNSLVTPDDTVVIAGDISWGMKLEETREDFKFIDRLPGKKIIIKGNHDYWWSTYSKITSFWQENDFSTLSILHNNAVRVKDICVCGTRGWLCNSIAEEDKKIVAREALRLRASLNEAQSIGGKPIVFLHYPPVYDTVQCDEIMMVMKEYAVGDCYFGHIHGSSATKKIPSREVDGIKMHLISCDYLGFSPKKVV